jgi:hypothetical protein
MRLGSKKANYVDANTMYSEIGLYVPTINADGQGGYTTPMPYRRLYLGILDQWMKVES